MSIYKDCDIRGVYGVDLTEQDMSAIGAALAVELAGRSIVVGGDYRLHTPPLKAALIDALVRGGAAVYDVGQVSTPQLYFSKTHLGTYASAQVTASHNPAKYNGLKLMLGQWPITPEDIRHLAALAASGASVSGSGSVTQVDTGDAYADMVRKAGNAARPLHMVIDAGNGAMSQAAPAVMASLGHRVEPLFCDFDGSFPNRDPNPAVPSHLTALCRRVRETGADFGVAFDGDGDRAIFVDGDGVPLLAEEALVIFANHLVQPGDTVVYDLKCSSIFRRAVEARGGTAIMERSGHAFIRRTFMERGSVLAGEVSGHYFFRELAGDDGLYALAVLSSILSRTDRTLRQLLDGVSYPAITPDLRIQASGEEIDAVLARMEQWAANSGAAVSRLDGIRLEFPDGSWTLLRRSITEPAFTVRLEAPTAQGLQQLREQAAQALAVPQLAE